MRPQLTQSQSILLVEDNQDDYEATCRAFKKANLRNPIVWCKSGRDAMDFLKQQGAYKACEQWPAAGACSARSEYAGHGWPQDFRGYQTGRLIETDPGDHPDYVFADERDIQACYRTGANTYVQKPVSFDGLIEAIKRLKEYWFEIALLPKGADHG